MKVLPLYLLIFITFLVSTSSSLAANKSLSKILFLGDSLTEGYQLEQKASFPSQIEVLLKKDGYKTKVLNGGVAGSTTASGMSRMRWFKKANPDLLVLALGANDGLRGFSLDESYKNLEKIIIFAKENKMKILLCGMKMPPNYGEKYRKGFEANYTKLKDKYNLKYYPFLLKGVGGNPKLNLADGIHPNEEGYKIIAKNLYEVIKKEFL